MLINAKSDLQWTKGRPLSLKQCSIQGKFIAEQNYKDNASNSTSLNVLRYKASDTSDSS